MIGKLEPNRRRLQIPHRGAVLFAAGGNHVVACLEPATRIPVSHLRRIRRRPPGQDRDHRAARIGGEQVGGAECSVVEMGRHHDNPLQDRRVHEAQGGFFHVHGRTLLRRREMHMQLLR